MQFVDSEPPVIAKIAADLCKYQDLSTSSYSTKYIRQWASYWVPSYVLAPDGFIADPIEAKTYEELLVIPNSFSLFQKRGNLITPIDSYSSLSSERYHRHMYANAHNASLDYESARHSEPSRLVLPRGKVGFLLLWHQDHYNYWHFVFDIAFRLFFLLENCPSLADHLQIIAVGCSSLKPFQLQLLAAILGKQPMVTYSSGPVVISNAIYIPPTQSLLPRKNLLQAYVRCLQRRSLNINNPGHSADLVKTSQGRTFKKVYVSRGNARNPRYLTNEAELVGMLTRYGFTVHDPGALSVSQQATLFAEAEIIIGVHGSALVNIIYSLNPRSIIEITSTDYDPFHDFMLARQLDLPFVRLKQKSLSQTDQSFQGHHRPFQVDLSMLSRALETLS